MKVDHGQLDRLRNHSRTPTIGEISLAIRDDVRSSARPSNGRRRAEILTVANSYFGERADYLLWRCARRFESLKLAPNRVYDQVDAGLESWDDAIVWSILSLLPTLATRSGGRDRSAWLQLLEKGERRMLRSLRPLRGGEVDCAAISALMLGAVEQLRHELYGMNDSVASTRAALEQLDRFERCLQEVDALWRPGRRLMMTAFKSRSRQSEVVVIPLPPMELGRQMVQAITSVHDAARATVTTLSSEGEQVLERAFKLSMTAWQTARNDRFGIERLGGGAGGFAGEDLTAVELAALFNASQAAMDAGRVLSSAALAHLLLRLIPDALLKTSPFSEYGDRLGRSIRKAGLEVDDRFERSREQNKIIGRRIMDGPKVSSWPGTRAWRARVLRDQQAGLWGRILELYGPGAGHLRKVLDDAETGALVDPEIIRTAFQLCLRYGWVDDACVLLAVGRFSPSRVDLLDFAHNVKRALQVMPFGVNVNVLREWHRLLRIRWSMAVTGAAVDEALVVHEVLLGRAASAIVASGRRGAAREFANRYYGQLSALEVRELVDKVPGARQHGPATATIETVNQFLESFKAKSFREPVCVSVVNLGDVWSILVVADGGRWENERVNVDPAGVSSLLDYAETLKASSRSWSIRAGLNGSLVIPWGMNLMQLGKAIVRCVERVNSSAAWIVLAIEPSIAGLPWQNLMSSLGRGDLLISIVPSITWASLGRATNAAIVPPTALLSDDANLMGLRQQILTSKRAWARDNLSIACVLGHGIWGNGFASVRVGRRTLELSDWLDIATHRVIVAHTCFGGETSDSFSGDLGGLPGPCLSIGCRLFCAPVTDVPIETAAVLSRHLFDSPGPPECGERYLSAIAEDPRVSLYNLYGLASEATARPTTIVR